MDEDTRHEFRRFLSDHPGHPLGKGYPLGRTLRHEDIWVEASGTFRTESHLNAWEGIVRQDPCAYCGEKYSGTVDHIEAKSRAVRGIGTAWSWVNEIGSCEKCNGRKGDRSMLHFIAARNSHRPRVKRDDNFSPLRRKNGYSTSYPNVAPDRKDVPWHTRTRSNSKQLSVS